MKKKLTIEFLVPEFMSMYNLRDIFDRGLENYTQVNYWTSEDTVYGFSVEVVQASEDWNQSDRSTETLIITAIRRDGYDSKRTD